MKKLLTTKKHPQMQAPRFYASSLYQLPPLLSETQLLIIPGNATPISRSYGSLKSSHTQKRCLPCKFKRCSSPRCVYSGISSCSDNETLDLTIVVTILFNNYGNFHNRLARAIPQILKWKGDNENK